MNPESRTMRTLTLLLLALLIAVPVLAFDSIHSSMQMVWNAGSFDCDTIEMTLVGDGIWKCSAPVALPDTYYFQCWPEGSLGDKYGADIFSPGFLVYDDDPSQAPVVLTENGYYYFQIDETLLTYGVTAASGSIVLQVQFNDDPAVSPGNVGAEVVDSTEGPMLGFYPVGTGDVVMIGNLIPGHDYEIVVAADGYDSEVLTVTVPDGTPIELTVTLDKLVSNQNNTWSGIKNLYR